MHRDDFPPFCQYYEDTKTAFAHLLAFGFPRLGYRHDTTLFISLGMVVICTILRSDYLGRVNPLRPLFMRRREALPGFPEILLYICHAIIPRPNRCILPFPMLWCCPRIADYEDFSVYEISRLNHTAFALAVYASCQHLY